MTSTDEKKSERKTRFRLSAKNVFLTYPQCDTPKQVALDRTLEVFERWDPNFIIVAREEHKDGNPHLHLLVSLNKRCNFKSERKLDVIGGKHGDYAPCRSLSNSIKYVLKNGDILLWNVTEEDLDEMVGPKKALDKLVHDIKSGKTNQQICESSPGLYLMHSKRIMSLRQELSLWERSSQLLSKEPHLNRIIESLETSNSTSQNTIAEWIRTRLAAGASTMKLKDPHLWIYGASNLRKTSLVRLLQQMMMAYLIPIDEDFYDLYPCVSWSFAYIDEFKGQKTIQWLNQWLDGPMLLRIKGAQHWKSEMLPTIILSNFSIDECYPNVAQNNPARLDLLYNRFTVVKITEPLSIPESLEEE